MIPAGTAILDYKTQEVICYTANDIHSFDYCRASSFERFTEGNTPWKPNELIDARCTKSEGLWGGLKIYTENGWGP